VAQGSGWLSESYSFLLWGSRGWKDLYKVQSTDILQKQWAMLTSNKISSLVVDTLREQTRGQNIVVLSLYCDYQAQRDQSVVNMIGGLLRQVVLGAPSVPGEIKSAFDESKRGGGQGLRLQEILKLFVKTINSIGLVYICVDAVDEVWRQHRSEFLRALRQVIQDAPNVRLFITGRPYIRGELDKHLTKGAYIIHIAADQGDIRRYLSQKIDDDDDQDPGLMTEDLKNDIMKTILEKASDMWVGAALLLIRVTN